jgi:hypothetical protein
MSNKRSGGIGIGTIIFWLIVGYMWWGGDNKKETKIITNEKTSVSDTVRDSAQNIKKEFTKIIKSAKKRVEIIVDENKKEKEKEKPKEEKEETVAKKEEKQTPVLSAPVPEINQKPETKTELKKL